MSAKCRKTPCSSCPYRKDVPSGVWGEEEYVKLEEYDRGTSDQPMATFMCHQPTEAGGTLCAGWVHTHGDDLLAIRLGTMMGTVDPSVFDVIDAGTDVELFASGTEASEHGREEIEYPGEEARALVAKIEKVREAIGWEDPRA